MQPLFWIDNIKKNDYLPDGRRARNLSKEEKLTYLLSLGYLLDDKQASLSTDSIMPPLLIQSQPESVPLPPQPLAF